MSHETPRPSQTVTLRLETGPLVADIYEPEADDGRAPVLLIHGWGGSGRYWRDTIARLRDRYRLIVSDLPGIGRSLPVSRPLDMLDELAAVEALLQTLGVGRARVVGHSMGGGIGMLLAARRPELVERLVVTSLSLFRDERERRMFGAAMEMAGVMMKFRAGWMEHVPLLMRASAQRLFYRVPDDQDLLRESFREYLEMDYGTALACARSAGSRAVVDAAPRIAAPTLLIVCREDRFMPVKNADLTVEAIPDCRIHWFERCGHLPMVERADAYAAVVRAFLDETPERAAEHEPAEAVLAAR